MGTLVNFVFHLIYLPTFILYASSELSALYFIFMLLSVPQNNEDTGSSRASTYDYCIYYSYFKMGKSDRAIGNAFSWDPFC